MSEDIKDRVRRIRAAREGPPAETSPGALPVATPEKTIEGGDRASSRLGAGRWPEVSLRLRFRDGRQHALPYVMLQDIVFDPGGGLVLEYAHCRARLRGRGLAPLFDRLADHKVRYVQEVDELAAERFDEGETVVTAIAVEKQ